jgi:nucleoside-diphosphate-sugar epimerase
MTTLLDLKDIIGNAMGYDDVKYDQYEAIAGEALNIRADITKAKSIGWEPKKSITDTIKETIIYLNEEIKKGNIDPLTFMTDLQLEKVKI